jgi:hypothetical protein
VSVTRRSSNTKSAEGKGKVVFNAFVGYQEQLKRIKDTITHPREASVINVLGAYGSGRSSLLDFIRYQLTQGEWTMPQTNPPIVIVADGQSFVSGDRFLEFLAHAVNPRLALQPQLPIPILGEEPVDKMIEQLRILSTNDYPVIIMIDNFTRVLTRMEEGEVQDLNRLKFGGLHYILVTDSRSLHEIAPKLVHVSDFLRSAQHVAFPPLSKTDALTFLAHKLDELQKDNQEQGCVLAEDVIDYIVQLAGGNPGLLYAVLKKVYFDRCGERQNKGGNVIDRSGIETQKFLRYLPEDDGVKYYLNNLLASVDFLSDDEKRHFLVDIAMENVSSDAEWNMLQHDTALHKRLHVMGFIVDPAELRFGSRLLQYHILSQVMPISFSISEKKAISMIVQVRPSLVTFEQLSDLLKTDADTDDPEVLRRYVDSTIARIRKKLERTPNRGAFTLNNVRGQGFYMASSIPFDIFLNKGTKIFGEEAM